MPMPIKARVHGTPSSYVGSTVHEPCHCELCRKGWREYIQRYRLHKTGKPYERPSRVDKSNTADTVPKPYTMGRHKR